METREKQIVTKAVSICINVRQASILLVNKKDNETEKTHTRRQKMKNKKMKQKKYVKHLKRKKDASDDETSTDINKYWNNRKWEKKVAAAAAY